MTTQPRMSRNGELGGTGRDWLAIGGLGLTLIGLLVTRTSLPEVGWVSSTYWAWAGLVPIGGLLTVSGSLGLLLWRRRPLTWRAVRAGGWIVSWCLLIAVAGLFGPTTHHLMVDGTRRGYEISSGSEAGASDRRPAILLLHGLGQSSATMRRLTGFDGLARREGFVVVYPKGVLRSWNDGDDLKPATRRGVDDLAFLESLIAALPERHGIDPTRIYAAGFSNGGYVLVRHACALAERVAAAAIVGAGVYPLWPGTCPDSRPLPALFVLGSDDPTVEALDERFEASPSRSAELWAKAFGCAATETPLAPPDVEAGSSCPEPLAEMALVDGAGHVWPGGVQYLPSVLVGHAAGTYDATSSIWRFAQRYALGQRRGGEP